MANSMLWAPQLETETHVSSVKFNVYKHTASHHSNLLQSHNVKAKTCHNSFRMIRMIHARDPKWFPEIPTSFSIT